MALLLNKLKMKNLAKVPVRFRNSKDHWATLRKKKTNMDKALEHFDDFYGSVYGKFWEHIRPALLQEEHKYVAVVNNFSDTERVQKELESQGAIHMKSIYDLYRKTESDVPQPTTKGRKMKKKQTDESNRLKNPMDSVLSDSRLSEVRSLYPADYEQAPTTLKSNDEDTPEEDKPLQPVELKSIEPELNQIAYDEERIIHSTSHTTKLYEYVPATELKGLEDWVLESEYYGHYSKGLDFTIQVENERILTFPEHLHVYTFERENNTRFTAPKKGSTGVLDYYLFDGGSILPVLALDLQYGDVVLDMCAAPGGKTLSMLQTLMPRILVANDRVRSRVQRIQSVLDQYVSGIGGWDDKLFLTEQDARRIEEKDTYNKILVDVPCTTDRHVLHSNDNNLFKSTRIKERLQIPEMQTEILTNALKLVRTGGTVVYSTCSLSPVQNDGVVQMAMKKAWEETDSVMIVKDMSKALKPLNSLYSFAKRETKYGHVVCPTLENNWGPMYFCKIVRVK